MEGQSSDGGTVLRWRDSRKMVEKANAKRFTRLECNTSYIYGPFCTDDPVDNVERRRTASKAAIHVLIL